MTTSTQSIQFFALSDEGPRSIPVREGVRHAHELFDDLPLGVYSAFRTFDHERFLGLDLHLDRTDRSMELLGWPERIDRPRLCAALDEVCRAYPGPDAFVRFDVLAEESRAHGERELIALSPLQLVPESYLREGVGVHFTPLRRVRPLIKSARFVVERRPYPLGRQDAFEHLLVDDAGRVREGTSSNFLALLDGTLRLAGDGALQGVTQRFVARLAREAGLAVEVRPLQRDELERAAEAFLTGSTRGVVPIVSLEGRKIGDGRPGEWTRRLARAYAELARREARPAWPLAS